jgi:RNA polymerase sigma factor (sigma-70 family)
MATAQATVLLKHLRDLVAADKTTELPDAQLLEQFTSNQEEAAFESLVRRYGPLVLGVCRRVLRHWHDAEDAFQATFLVFARKAASIRKVQSLGSWLHGVAYHVAMKVRQRSATRHKYEPQARQRPSDDPLTEITARELVSVLDEELQRLSERHRTPLVLCYLEGLTCDEAARRAGWSLSTFKRRLARARELLRLRLARRGLALPASLLAVGVVQGETPALLTSATVQAALQFIGVKGAAGAVTTPVTSLAAGMLRSLCAAKLKLASAAVLLFSLALLGIGTIARRATATVAPPEEAAPVQSQPAKGEGKNSPPADKLAPKTETSLVSGRVIEPDGKAAVDTHVAIVARSKRPGRGGDLSHDQAGLLGRTKTDAEGGYQLSVPAGYYLEMYLLAGKKGWGLTWQKLGLDAKKHEILLKLRPEKVIRGRFVDLQGQPATGVKVHLHWVSKGNNGLAEGISFWAAPPKELFAWPKPVRTDAKGAFVLTGVAADDEVGLGIDDDRFARQGLYLSPKDREKDAMHPLSPAQIVEGQVRAADTGKPLAFARLVIYAFEDEFTGRGIDGKADGEGRFHLNPPPGKSMQVMACPRDGSPYLVTQTEFKWPKGAAKHIIDLKLPRGILVIGKVTEEASGKAIAQAGVQYFPQSANNPDLPQNVVTGWQGSVVSGVDGTFKMAVPAGPGHLLVSGPTADYVHQEVGSRILDEGKPGGSRYYPDGLVKLDLPAKTETKEVVVKLRRGVPVRGRVVGPNDKAVSRGLMIHRLHVWAPDMTWRFPVEIRDGIFEIRGLDPKKSYPVSFLDPVNHWGATVTISGKQAGGEPLTVKLLPCGKAVARFIGKDGKPMANHQPMPEIVVTPGTPRNDFDAYKKGLLAADADFLANVDRHNYWNGPSCDAEGRCTFVALIPGVTYRFLDYRDGMFVVQKEFTAVSGKTLELGDIRVSSSE